jgi:hypothetical protein
LHEIDELTGHTDPLKPEHFRKFAAADVAARTPKGNRAPTFPIRSPRMITEATPCLARSEQLKPSFNKSAQNCPLAPKSAGNAAQAADENSGPRDGIDHLRIPFCSGEAARPRVRRAH